MNIRIVLFCILFVFVNEQIFCKSILENKSDSIKYEIAKSSLRKTSDPKEILKYSNIIDSCGIKLKNTKWRAIAKFYKADAYIIMGELDVGINYLYECVDLYSKINHKLGIATVYVKLADCYLKDNSKKKSFYCYKKALDIYKNSKDTLSYCGTLLNLGELYRLSNDFELSFKYFDKADSICEEINCNYYMAFAKGNIGLVYTAQNKLDSAEIYLNKSIEVLEPLGDNYAVSSYLDGLAEVYFKRKQYLKAKQTSLKSLKLAQEHGLKEQIRDASLRLSTIYNQSKEFEKAFFHHKQYVAYRDSINNEENIRKIANLRTKYEVAQKQKEVDQEKAQKERYLIVAIAAVSILIILTVLVFIILKISRYRKKVNLKLKDQRQELANANATKNKFFSILSHDLRSPLATFHSYSEVMDLCASHQDLDKLKEISREMKSSSANMLDLLDNLLQWGVNQMGTKKSVPANVSLKDVVLMEVKHLQHVSDKKNIIVLTPIEKDVTLFVDRVKLAMAVRNLLNNAIKFTPSGGTITISSYQENTQTILKVSDTGVGMTPEQRDRLFDFTDINSTYGTQNEKGVGLGMQLVCEFVKLSNASIKVESELGVGTTFIITFYNNVS